MFGSMTDSPNRRDGINWGKVGLYGAGTAVAAGATIHGYKKFMGSKAGQTLSDGTNWTKETARGASNWLAGEGGWNGRMGQAKRALGFGGGAEAMRRGGSGMIGSLANLGSTPIENHWGQRAAAEANPGRFNTLLNRNSNAAPENRVNSALRAIHGEARGAGMMAAEGWRGQAARGASLGLGWATAADYAGQGWKRAGAVGARGALAMGAIKGVSAGLDWAFGG